MRCPTCGNLQTRLTHTRHNEQKTVTRRRHYCSKCKGRFTTYEQAEPTKDGTAQAIEQIRADLKKLLQKAG